MIYHYGYTQMAYGDTLGFFTDFTKDVFPGFSIGTVFLVGMCQLAFWCLLVLYLWPLKIDVDPEADLKWYYPFTKSFWCGASRVNHV